MMYRHTVVVALAMFAMAAVTNGQTSNYCTICSQRVHTMCKYQDLSVGSTCRQNKQMVKSTGGVDSDNQTSIVALHNTVRNKVAGGLETRGVPGPQPSATNMHVLVWDTELATEAQRWADQCTALRDTCRKVDRFTVGQNVMMTTSTTSTPAWSDVIDAWAAEAKRLNNAKVTNYVERKEQKSHHYSRMVWGPSTKIGCGFSAYTKTSSSSRFLLYVCNYGPGGIPLSSTVSLYQTGTGCSNCGTGSACDTTYTSLCTP